jgi:predicted nuclease with TOPRIM domain
MQTLQCGKTTTTKRKLEGDIRSLAREREGLLSECENARLELEASNARLRSKEEEMARMKEIVDKEVKSLRSLVAELRAGASDNLLQNLLLNLEELHQKGAESVGLARDDIMRFIDSKHNPIRSVAAADAN